MSDEQTGQASGSDTNTQGGAPQGGAPQGGQGAAPPSGNNTPWYSSFTTGLEAPEAEAFTSYAGRYQNPAEFAKATVNLRKSHDSRIPLPSADAPEEAWNEIYDKMGRPKDPMEYKFNHLQDAPPLMDIEEEARENFRGVAHRLGLNQKQIDGLTQWNDSLRKTQFEAFEKAPEHAAAKAKETLQSKYGPDTNRNLNIYRATARQYFGGDLQAASQLRLDDGSFVLDHPVIADALIRVGLERTEEQRGMAMLSTGERASVQQQIQSVEEEAWKAGKTTADEPYYSKLKPLYQKLHGKANVASSGVYGGST